MITVEGTPIQVGTFPDGTPLLHLSCREMQAGRSPSHPIQIVWNYEHNEELLTLYYVTCKLQEVFERIDLYMPYVPNARQDRVKAEADVFTLKYFARLINNLEFHRVYVLDPHSHVASALLDRVEVIQPTEYIQKAILRTGEKNLTLFYPDEGAMKRYSQLIQHPYTFGIKRRDWESGKIAGLDVAGELVPGAPVLMVDDICSYGGTFLHAARKLRELGAGKLYLYVTHCENTVLEGEVINSGLLERIFTTGSIFTKSHPLVEVLKGSSI